VFKTIRAHLIFIVFVAMLWFVLPRIGYVRFQARLTDNIPYGEFLLTESGIRYQTRVLEFLLIVYLGGFLYEIIKYSLCRIVAISPNRSSDNMQLEERTMSKSDLDK
jgi:hypothetical protein